MRQLNEWCKANGCLVVQEYVEPGASATDDKRQVFQQMINDAMAKPPAFDAIITDISGSRGRKKKKLAIDESEAGIVRMAYAFT